MEKKFNIIPFDVDVAKRIASGELEGEIITRVGGYVRNIIFDIKKDFYPISAVVEADVNREEVLAFTDKGTYYVQENTYDFDLMLKIPEYLTFKDGDIIAFGHTEGSIAIGIFHRQQSNKSHECYVKLDWSGGLVYDVDMLTYNNARFATKEERQKLICSLKKSKEHKAKEYLKRFFGIEGKKEYEFKVGQPVIGVDGRGEWRYDLFSHFNPNNHNGNYICSARSYRKCLPYNEQTAHLVGTRENWEDK